MKKETNGKGNIPERDEWETPRKLFDKLNQQYNFNYDCCCNLNNTKCANGSRDFLSTSFGEGVINWMNPPFSKSFEMFKHFFKVVNKGVAIYRCDNIETKVWQDIIFPNCSWVFIPKGRICYEGMKGKGSRFPSALIGLNVQPPKNIQGKVLKVLK